MEEVKWKFKEWPPKYDDSDSEEFIVCCGDSDFETNLEWFGGLLWWLKVEVDKVERLMRSFKVTDPFLTKDKKPTLCAPNELGTIYKAESKTTLDLVLLCDDVFAHNAKSARKDTASNLAEWATYEALESKKRLNYGVFYDDITSVSHALSAILFHEIFHLTSDESS
jgi:hypothetical protein